MELLELGTAIVFAVGDANGSGADVEVAMLVITLVRRLSVELQLDVD